MKRMHTFGLLLSGVASTCFMLSSIADAADRVVVVPLGGAVGNATTADVLKGKTFSSKTGKGLAGTMDNKGAITIAPGTTDLQIPAGYHNGSGTVQGDNDLIETNIRDGVELFKVIGVLKKIVCGDVDVHCTPVAGNACSYNEEACCITQYGKTCAETFIDCKIPGELPCYVLGYCDGKEHACINISNKLSQ